MSTMDKPGTPIDREKLLSLGYLSQGQTRNRVVDAVRPDTGERCKRTTDELGNTVTESANRQDVQINAPTLVVRGNQVEERRQL